MNEDKKDFNAMLGRDNGMPKIQVVTDPGTVAKYGGSRMYFAPPRDYDRVMRLVPMGKLVTVGDLREFFVREHNALHPDAPGDFCDPITAGIFVSVAAWASFQRAGDKIPYWRTLKANGELHPKYPGGVQAQKELLEAEGHRVEVRGRTALRYYVADWENAAWRL